MLSPGRKETRASSLFVAFALVGCGAIEEPSSPPPETRPPANETQTPSTPATPAPPNEPQREGSIHVHTIADDLDSVGISIGAEFGEKRNLPASSGGCTIEDLLPPPEADVVATPSDSAGTIEVGLLLGSEQSSLKLAFDPAKKQYESFGGTAKGHAVGTIRVRARGATVPAFAVELPALSPVHVLSPAQGATVTPGDLPVSWTFEGENVPSIIRLMAGNKIVRCVSMTEHDYVIPAALVTEALAPGGDVTLMVTTLRTIPIDAGDYRVSVTHNTSAMLDLVRQ